MAIRIVGPALAAFGLLLAWLMREGPVPLLAIALLVASGAWIAGVHRVLRQRDPALATTGGLFVGWGLAGGVTAARHELWVGVVVCALMVYAGLLLVDALPTPGWVQKAAAAFRRTGVGWLFMGAGLLFVIEGFAGRAAKDVPAFVLVAAGVTFFVGGALAFVSAPGSEDTVLRRSLVALLITALTGTATVFPPSLLFMAPFTVLAWIAVVRLLVQNRTGRDPLTGWSDERQLGLGCGLTVVLALIIFGVWQLRSCTP